MGEPLPSKQKTSGSIPAARSNLCYKPPVPLGRDYADCLRIYIDFARLMVVRDRRILAMIRDAKMGKLDEFADNVPDTLKQLEDKFGGLQERANELLKRGDEVASKWGAHMDGRDKALTAAENAINRISNLPLPASPQQPKDSPKPFREGQSTG